MAIKAFFLRRGVATGTNYSHVIVTEHCTPSIPDPSGSMVGKWNGMRKRTFGDLHLGGQTINLFPRPNIFDHKL